MPFALPPEGLTIGRSDNCGLVLADPLRQVSREHAQVITYGLTARVRCISQSSPLWVNDVQLNPGAEQALLVGDRLRIGQFELAVEPLAAAAQRARLDRWFDLGGALDPLAAESPLPALAASPEVEATSAVVSWQTSRHVLRTGAWLAPSAASKPPVPPRVPAYMPPVAFPPQPEPVRSTPHAPPSRALGSAGGSAAAAVRPPPGEDTAPPQTAAFRSGNGSPELRELTAAFARGAGLGTEVAPLTPEWMEHLGALLRATAEGTLALLQSRAVAKRHMRAQVTHIAPRQNNPLKFAPDATEALTRMLKREASPGFLDPVAALHDAHRDLLVHQVAMVAGMRAAVFELFSRLGPAAAENAEGPARGISRVPLLRAAGLWRRYCLQHTQLLEHLDDDFESIFGREFLRAYEAQSQADADADRTPPEASWPNGR
jgi:type VI secretion system FHA domain protein